MISLRTRGSLVVLLATLMISCLAFGATEDIIHMDDGRVLHGQIIKETDSTIVFDRFNSDLGISVTITLPKSKIVRVERDVETDGTDGADAPPVQAPGQGVAEPPSSSTGAPVSTEQLDEEVASLYIVPMHGDVGTDINSEIYQDAIDEINSIRPDVVVFELDSEAMARDMLSWWMGTSVSGEGNWWERDPLDQTERINFVVADVSTMLENFHYKILPDVRQVVWAKDASGAATLLALGWEEMYMHPDARFGTLGMLWAWTQGFDDDDVRGKMEEYQLGAVQSLAQFGKHDPNFVEGLLNPYVPLSFSCRGRKAIWDNHYFGDIPVHQDGEGFDSEIRQYYVENTNGDKIPMGLEFDARPSEELLISDGTAETLQELAMLMGYREYKVEETKVLLELAEYVPEWRAKLKRAYDAFQDYRKHMERGTLSDLQKAKTSLQRVINQVKSDRSVALRMKTLFGGLDLTTLEALMMQLKSRIRQMAAGGGGGGAGGGGGGRGGGGGPQRP